MTRIIAAFLIALFSHSALAISPYWQTANPLSDSMNTEGIDSGNLTLFGAYYSGTETIAVGERGAILTTTDGINWVARQSGITLNLNNIFFDGDQYIAVSRDGVFVTSTNLTDWQTGNIGSKVRLRDIVFKTIAIPGSPVTKRYVAVGDNGALLTSTDTIDWTKLDSGTGVPLLAAVWDAFNSRFIVAGGSPPTSQGIGVILTSEDGVTWTQQAIGGEVLYDIVTDGSGNSIVVGDNGSIWRSSNGVDWNPALKNDVQLPAGYAENLFSIAYDGMGRFVTVGTNGAILYSDDGGDTWSVSDSGVPNTLFGVAWNGSRFVVAGTNVLLSSSDPSMSIWSYGNSPISDLQTLTGVATNTSGTNLAVSATGDVFSSTDGLDWQSVAAATGHNFTALTWDGSQYVAIENGSDILTSADGASWATQASGIGSGLNGIAYSGGAYVVVGDSDLLRRSTNLINWSTPNVPASSGGDLTGITWNNDIGEFLVVANVLLGANDYQVTALHSSGTSGQVWSAVSAYIFSPIAPLKTPLNAVAWNGSQYVGVSQTSNILFSNDGNDWQHPDRPDTIRGLNGITWSANLQRFITVGNNGTVLVSAGADTAVFSNTLGGTATEFDPFGYSFFIQNNSTFSANNIELTITLPADTELGNSIDPRCTPAGLILTCALGDMAGGGGSNTSVYIQVTPLSALVHQNLAVQARVAAAGPEAQPHDNQLVTATYVQSLQDKIADDFNNKTGGGGLLSPGSGAGSLNPLYFGVLALSVMLVARRRRSANARG